MMSRINLLEEEIERLAEENERFINKSEKSPEKYDFPYQVKENSYTSIAIKTISNLHTLPSSPESEIQNLTKLKTENPFLERSHKRKKQIKNPIETKRKKL